MVTKKRLKGRRKSSGKRSTKNRTPAKGSLSYAAWDALQLEEVNPLLSRKLVVGQDIMLARILLKKGCVVPLHSHHNEQVSYMLEGALKFWIDGKELVVRAGEVLAIPPHMPHKAEALADSVSLDVFSPPRADWINGTDRYLRAPEAKESKKPQIVG
jgi:unsaturated pyranuronate lyase